jgi:hypothetical protein
MKIQEKTNKQWNECDMKVKQTYPIWSCPTSVCEIEIVTELSGTYDLLKYS